jgi:hypothetical protein
VGNIYVTAIAEGNNGIGPRGKRVMERLLLELYLVHTAQT